jgi:peptidoglycan/LPS O-acetylase OafA/YrhL
MTTREPTPGPDRHVTFDAMRGVAAITVVIGHFGMVASGSWPAHYYLAVDLFFTLSGFVLASNYDHRFAAGLAAFGFMRSRAIRLWPMVLIGAVLGLLVQLNYSMSFGLQLHSFVSFMLACFGLPSPAWPLVQPAQLFPINTVFWTLMLEFWVANLTFAVFWKWLHGPWLWALIAAGLAGLIASEHTYQNLAGGWGWGNWAVGLARVVYAFFLGVALSRRFPTGIPAIRLPGWIYVVDLAAVLFIQPGDGLGVVDLIDVILVLPALLVLAAGAREPSSRIGATLGDVSYALYALHLPFLVEGASLLLPSGLKVAPSGIGFYAAMAGAVVVLIVLSLLVDRLVDRPMRRWLTRIAAQ